MWLEAKWPQLHRFASDGAASGAFEGIGGSDGGTRIKRGPAGRALALYAVTRSAIGMDIDGCSLPEDRRYDLENSVWVAPDPDGDYRLGILAAQAALAGKFLQVTFRPLEGEQPAGRSVATLESYRYTGPARLPVGGTVLARNDAVRLRPKLLNDEPYARGWLVRFRPTDPAAIERSLEGAAEIAERLRERIREFRIRCFPALPDVELVLVGSECSAVLARLDEVLATRSPEEVIHLVTDDPTAPIEMVRWSDRSGHAVIDRRREGTLEHFLVRKEAHPRPRRRSEAGIVGDTEGP
jgi:glycine cleavage system H protein